MSEAAELESIDLKARVDAAVDSGMCMAVWADLKPDKTAVTESSGRSRTFGELNANANRLVRLMRAHGLQAGDSVAIVCSNRVEFPEVLFATLRGGFRMTPVNWHLKPDEIAYVVDNCEAKAVFADTRIAGVAEAMAACPNLKLKVAIGGDLPGFIAYAEIEAHSGENLTDPVRGSTMLYSSGTTGRPKGVYKPNAQAVGGFDPVYDREVDKHICTGPAYHASPLAGDIRRALNNGVPTVLMDRWDTEEVLRIIQDERITRGHFVPIMFQRMLALPEEVRAKYDLSSLKRITHGAAPCPPEVKRAMIEWLGPVLFEYYAGSEGGVGFTVTSDDWMKRPGTVGRRPHKDAARILDENGEECPVGVPGAIYLSLKDQGGFTYYKDDAKTESNRRDGYFTMGDVGYFDEDDWLFLTGRSAETIIAGGVNIYPQEIDNELIKHPAVEDSCTVGIPHDEWGEEVRAVIQLKAGYEPSEALKREILDYAAQAVAKFKIPRSVDFVTELPRSEAGKIQRNKVRAPYWEGRARAI
ncbi:MAG: AMP-binding protein [Phenylobacterium sp.]|uniref:AMP-binding protein n=1 Tax=Phenylobacterium sp. TaxID=1871053 RepID=UPI001B5E5217|nr:AMP-binding protein [Phenylobacterium sp.]MBP7814774.1 AMP-binding protein [Phenylobacterium sp.]MBP9231276.1 AMP-binding protein [Phenylobacterium sp.]MBP9754796.1 AMP-binding protein [Phenylobacterium sp.]